MPLERLYVLFDLMSGNVITDYANESDAWQALCRAAADDGLESIANLSLLRVEDGQPTLIAMDDDLVRRVERELGRVPGKR
jgi:hypothetical protein